MQETLEYRIIGDDMQIVEISLDYEQSVRAETGAMAYMDGSIEMNTSTGGGIFKGIKRAISGENFFITTFTNKDRVKQSIAFAAPYPGKILPLNMGSFGGQIICQKNSFLCADTSIEIDIAFTKRLGAGLFGGEGFILQRLSGIGISFAHAGGTIVEKKLKRGDTLKVDTGCIVAFEDSIDYDIEFTGGFTNALFGGEGLFMAVLRGEGRVFLQSLPFSRLADRIAAATMQNRGEVKRGGDFLGSILNGDR